MTHVTAVISMLHEGAQNNSATRRFRQEPVLGWTIERLSMSKLLGSIAILCWEDQLEHVSPMAEEDCCVLAKGPRIHVPSIESISAARRWADGWRGGLLATCDFDLGFHAGWMREIIEKMSSDAVVLVDPAAGLVDPKLIDAMILHASAHENAELCFAPAAPGLGGALLRPAMVDRLASAKTHPGKLLHYLPEQPMREPLGGESCVAVPTVVARTTRRFKLDSERQIKRLSAASVHLNGQLVSSDAEDLVNRLRWTSAVDSLPRELTLELTPRRQTRPIFSPLSVRTIERPEMTRAAARSIFQQLASADDLRLTLGGAGDPLLHPELAEIIADAREAGIAAIHVETDLLPENPTAIAALVDSGVDVVSFHLPGITAGTYAAIMGEDRFAEVLENVRRFIARRHENHRGVPVLAPIFTKCQLNLGEMETWYDQWLKTISAGVIVGPSTFGGIVPDCGVADMSPSRRMACARIASRMTILSDGQAVSCEQDLLGQQPMGDATAEPISEIWQRGYGSLRAADASGERIGRPVCVGCKEWHRP